MTRKRRYISQSVLRDRYDYHADGYFLARETKRRWKAGRAILGTETPTGHRLINVDGVCFLFHRLIWIWHNGDIPDDLLIDHIDEDPSNNRIENLRLATHSQNHMNSCKPRGYSWVVRFSKWKAEIVVRGKRRHLGYFHSKEEARAAYLSAKRDLHGEFVPARLRHV